MPAPIDAVRPRAFRRSALPVMLRSAPVPVVRVRTPAAMAAGVPDEVESAAAPAALMVFLTPLARSMAFARS